MRTASSRSGAPIPHAGAKIAYAPKEKPNGVVDHYYRSSDGKRVHVGRNERQVNVREDDILDQLGRPVDAIAVTEAIAHAITEGLNETHRQVRAAKAEAVKMFANANTAPDVFKRQQVRVREDRDDLFNRLQEACEQGEDTYPVTAQRVWEPTKTAERLWGIRSPKRRGDVPTKLFATRASKVETVRYDSRNGSPRPGARRKCWRPQGDSNPCRRREKPLSWAN